MIRLIYVCSALRGMPPYSYRQTDNNYAATVKICERVIKEGNAPIAPHMFYRPMLDDMDEGERALGLKLAAALIARCDEVRVYGDEISEGMAADIAVAERLGKPIIKGAGK